MRHLVKFASLMVCGMPFFSTPAAGQLFQPARNSTSAAPPTLNHFSGASHAPPAQPIPGRVNTGFRAVQQSPARSASPPQNPPRNDSRPQQSHSWNSGNSHQHHHGSGRGYNNGWWGWGASYPWGWSPWYTPAFAPVYPSVAFLPSVPLINTTPVTAFAPASAPLAAAPAPTPEPAGQPKITNPDQKAKAGKFLAFGDTNFASQKYLAALGRYKTAAQVAPDLGEPYFRQGHAHVALGQYSSAIKAFRRGLRIDGEWAASPFKLEQLYDGDLVAKTAHLENLAKAVEANPFSTDLLTLLGLELFFDGQRDRAFLCFERAAQLGGNEDRLLDDFLPKPAPAGEPQLPVPAKPVKPIAPIKPAAVGKVVF